MISALSLLSHLVHGARRFLLSENGDAKKAGKRFKETVAWRAEIDLATVYDKVKIRYSLPLQPFPFLVQSLSISDNLQYSQS